jgi:lambda family phage tail tape measure protein
MAELLESGVIEIIGDARKLRASIAEAKKQFRTLGDTQRDISRQASASIDQYIGKIQQQNAVIGKSAREQEVFRLAQRGASFAQLRTADEALRIQEANQKVAAAAAAQAQRIAEAQARSANVDSMIAGIKQQAAEFGKSQQQIELYRLKLQGATDEQLKAAGAALRLRDAQRKQSEDLAKTAESQRKAAAKSAGIDVDIANLRQQNAVLGKSAREAELFRLSMLGASAAQLKAADSALKFAESQQRIDAVLSRVKIGLLAFGAAAASALAFRVSGNIDFLDQINKLSKSTGLASEDLVGLNLVAQQTGTNIDSLAGAINRMTVEMGKDPEAFRQLGISAKDPLEAFGQLADLFNLLPDLQQKNALANKVFSKSWAEVAGTLQEGSKRIAEGVEKGKQLAGVTDENVKQADAFKSAVAEFSQAGIKFGAEFIPILTEIVQLLTKVSSFKFGGGGFLGLRGAIAGAKNDLEELARLNTAIEKTRETRDAFQKSSNQSLFGRLFNADDLAASNAQLRRLTEQRDKLDRKLTFSTEGVTELGSHSTPAEDDARQKALAAAQAAAARNAARFLDEGKKGPKDDAAARARQLAREQLDFDISEIRKGGELRVDAFQNAERILQAQRSASLVSDKDFFEARRAFIQAIAQEQERATQEEVARLQRETSVLENARRAAVSVGDKDKIGEADRDLIDNARKIQELQAKIAKTQADAVIATKINEIETTAAFERIEKSIREAKAAADDYIESIQRANQRELAGIGRGQAFRQRQAEIGQIDDRALNERRRLQGELRRGDIDEPTFERYLAEVERTYQREVELYEQRTAAIEAAQRDWLVGASEALQNYIDETQNTAKQFEDAFTRGFNNLEDLILDVTGGGIKSFKDLGSAVTKFVGGIAADLARIEIREKITGPLAEMARQNLPAIGGILGRPVSASAGSLIDTGEPITGVPGWLNALLGRTASSASTVGVFKEGVLPKASIPELAGGAGTAASGAAFSTAVTGAATGFSTAVTTAATTAGTTFTGEVASAGAAFVPQISGAGVSLSTALSTAATAFATTVTTAGTTFAATVTGASATSGADDLVAGIFGGFEFSEGGPVRGPGTSTSDSIPARLSNQEFVVRAAAAQEPGAPRFLQTFNEHGLAAAIASLRTDRGLEPGGGALAKAGAVERGFATSSSSGRAELPAAVAAVQPVSRPLDDQHRRVVQFAKGGIVSRPEHFPLPDGKTGLRGEAGPEAIMPLRTGEAGAPGVIVAGLPGVTLPVTRDAAGRMAVDGRVIERIRETKGPDRETIERFSDTRFAIPAPPLILRETKGIAAALPRVTSPAPIVSVAPAEARILALPEIRLPSPATPAPAALPLVRMDVRPQITVDAPERVIGALAGMPERARMVIVPGREHFSENYEKVSEKIGLRTLERPGPALQLIASRAVEKPEARPATAAQRVAVAVTAAALSMPLAAAPIVHQPPKLQNIVQAIPHEIRTAVHDRLIERVTAQTSNSTVVEQVTRLMAAPLERLVSGAIANSVTGPTAISNQTIIEQAARMAAAGAVQARNMTIGGATINTATINNVADAAAAPAAATAASLPFIGSFERGIPFVPRTGLAMLHQGERVVTAEDNRQSVGGDTITINVYAAQGQDPQEIARAVEQRMARRNRGMSTG